MQLVCIIVNTLLVAPFSNATRFTNVQLLAVVCNCWQVQMRPLKSETVLRNADDSHVF